MSLVSQKRRRHQRGYILLTLMLFVALLTIGMLALVQNIASQIKRDREQELIHRGVQYSRAVQHFYKKFNRYPARIEDLENTNNYRSLRKRYKDPITGKDFKILHMTDVQMSFSSGVPGGGLPPGGLPTSPAADAQNGDAPQQGGSVQDPTASQDAQPGAQNGGTGQPAGQSVQPLGRAPSVESGPASGQVFGGAPIVGVASASKDKTIREFNKKDHYNQWQFIYDPTSDRGGILMTPNQPPLRGAVQPADSAPNGAPPPPGQNPGPAAGPQGSGPMQPNSQPPDQ